MRSNLQQIFGSTFAARLVILAVVCAAAWPHQAQVTPRASLAPTPLRIGERLTYNISFEGYNDVGFAETFVVSRGKLGESDAVELRFRIKTLGILSAAFYQVDQTRTTFVSAEGIQPLMVRRTDSAGVAPKESVANYGSTPAPGLDLLTLIFRARLNGGVGSFVLSEGERIYPVTLQPVGGEKLKTDAGEFDTTVSTVESEYFTELGIRGLRVNFSNDDNRLPVLARFRTPKGEFRVLLSGVHIPEPEPELTPTPSPVVTPRPVTTPRPAPSPTPYVDDQPLSVELGFAIGETLRYRVTSGGRVLGDVTLRARERKQFKGVDSLLLTAEFSSVQPGNGHFSNGDSITTHVDPETLSPIDLTIRMSGPLSSLNRSAEFDQRTGTITFGGTNKVDAPVGTHNIISLLYAARSFNLKPSKDLNNPVNDTRVAVFWNERAYVFTLRPSEVELIDLNGEKVPAQRISITSGVTALDQPGLKFWLGNDGRRLPLRFAFGAYQADLLAEARPSVK